MTIAHLYPDFGEVGAQQLIMTDEALEEQRLTAFEAGYQAGWDDAAKAIAQEQSLISADLARNLQDMAFTYQEAESAVHRALEPLFDTILAKLLPAVARDSLSTHAISQLLDLSREVGGGACVITAAPSQADRITERLPEVAGLSVSVQHDTTLTDGQAFLRLGTRERMIDLDSTIGEIAQAVGGFFGSGTGVLKHG